MSDAEFELELVEALNMLLEDERASVEMEVALASGATEYGEREALAAMGVEDIRFCEQLRAEMELAGLAVTPQINGIVFQVIGAERYDDRLRAFAHHQYVVAEHARELQESNLEGALRVALEGITLTHDSHVEWTEQRANEFAATRAMEFGSVGHSAILLGAAQDERGDAPDDASSAEALPEADDDAPSTPPADADSDPAPTDAAAPYGGEADVSHAESGATPAEPDEPAAKPKPRARATSAAKAATKPAASKPRAPAKPRTSAATPRRARRAPATEEHVEA